MFRKLWKQIKIIVFVVIILACIPRSILPISSQNDDFEYYIKLNDEEKRLIQYKDSREALEIKLKQLDIINNSRKKYSRKPVKLDILASRVANKMSRDAADNNFAGHWNLAGEKPYHRYGLAGGYDHITENAYAEWSSVEYENTPKTISAMMKSGHETFMKEKAPNDGHKQAIIGKDHNYVGIGYNLSGKQFRYYEEFIDRYLEFENIPSEVKPGEQTSITIKTDGKNYPYYMIVYYENFPRPMTAKEIARKGSYNDYTEEQYQQTYAWELAKFKNGQTYKIPLTLNKEGLYYIHIFTDKKEYTKPASLSTKGRTPYSGIVIRVKR